MMNEITPRPTPKKPHTIALVQNLMAKAKVNNPTLKEKFANEGDFMEHGYQFIKKMTVGLEPNYSDVRNSTLSYLYLMRNTTDIFADCARCYVGLTDEPCHRCKVHRVGIRSYLLAEDDACNASMDDQNFAEAMLGEKYIYSHVVLPQITRTAHRILEDILMISLKAGVNEDILTNVNQGVTMVNHRDYGIHSDADRYAIGANLLTHLLDSDEKTIDVLESSEVVHQAQFACPLEKCTAVLGRLDRVKKHLTIVHKMKNQLEIIDLLDKVPKLKCSFVGCAAE